jgi:hypothetical protein
MSALKINSIKIKKTPEDYRGPQGSIKGKLQKNLRGLLRIAEETVKEPQGTTEDRRGNRKRTSGDC